MKKPNIKNGLQKPKVFLGLSGAELIEARASMPIVTPDRFRQANINQKISIAKMVGAIDEYVQQQAQKHQFGRLYWHTQETNLTAQRLYSWIGEKPDMSEDIIPQ